MAEVKPFLVAGRWRRGRSALEVRRPHDGRLLARVGVPGARDVEAAIAGACKAFARTRAMPAYARAEVLWRARDALKDEARRFARLIAQEAGKPLKHARVEVARALATLALSAEEATRVGGEVFAADIYAASASKFAFTKRFPVGPVSAITPFNFPLNLVLHKAGPALACGCPVVVKPSERTPLTALELGRLLVEAGAVPGSVSVLPVNRAHAAPFVEDPRFKLLSFTGSAQVGWRLKAAAGKKKVVLELGGNAGVVVDEGTDLSRAAEKIAAAAFGYAGQSCISVQRVLVHRRVYGAFRDALLRCVRRLRVGDPLDPRTDVGPLIHEDEARRVEAWIEEARQSGARVLAGGTRDGAFVAPTVLEGVSRQARVYREEAFAPLCVLAPFASFEEALRELNRSRYGLQAGVFTPSLERALRAFHALEVGGVVVNDVPTTRVDNQPYGGVKDSGLGREGVRYAIEDMTEVRVCLVEAPSRFL